MFDSCISLTTVEVSLVVARDDSIGNVNAGSMFENCTSLQSAELSGWRITLPEDNFLQINALFDGDSDLTEINISEWEISRLPNLSATFRNCSSLQEIDLSSLSTSCGRSAFTGCTSLQRITVGPNWKLGGNRYSYLPYRFMSEDGVTIYDVKDPFPAGDGMSNQTYVKYTEATAVYFADNQSLIFFKRQDAPQVGDNWEGHEATAVYTNIEVDAYRCIYEESDGYGYMINETTVPWHDLLDEDDRLPITYVKFEDRVRPVSLASWFSNLGTSTDAGDDSVVIDFSWCLDTINVTDMSNMFRNSLITQVNGLDDLITSSVTDMSNMFRNCDTLSGSLSISSSGMEGVWDTSNVTDMSGMFANCAALTNISITDFDVSSVTDMSRMFDGCEKLYDVTFPNSLDTSNVTDMSAMFRKTKLSNWNFDGWDTTSVTSMASMFEGCASLNYVYSAEGLDTGSVTDLSCMFESCTALSAPAVALWDTSNVTDMHEMFAYCRFEDLDLSAWDTSNVKNMSAMFRDFGDTAYYGSTLNVSGWVTDNVQDISLMFQSCHLEILDLSSFNVDNVESSYGAFADSTELVTVYVSDKWGELSYTQVENKPAMVGGKGHTYDQFDAGLIPQRVDRDSAPGCFTPKINVVYKANRDDEEPIASYLYRYHTDSCEPQSLSYDGGYCDTWVDQFGNVWQAYTDTYITYQDDHAFEDIILTPAVERSFAVYDEQGKTLVFYNQKQVPKVGETISYYTSSEGAGDQTVSQVWTDIEEIEYDYQVSRIEDESGEISVAMTTNVPWQSEDIAPNIEKVLFSDPSNTDHLVAPVSIAGWFQGLVNCEKIDLERLDASSVTDMSCMFANDARLGAIYGIDEMRTSNVTDMSYMFYRCMSLRSDDLSTLRWDTSNVTDMSYMFADCSSLGDLSLQRFDTANVSTMTHMFAGCTNLDSIYAPEWETSNVTDMSYMFFGCQMMTGADCRFWEVESVSNMSHMFAGCEELCDAQVQSFHTDSLTKMDSLFAGCNHLEDVDVSRWDVSGVEDMSYVFYGCNSIPELDLSRWETSQVESIEGMFMECGAELELDLSAWSTYQITNMAHAFDSFGAPSGMLCTLDLSGWDVSQVTNASGMFKSCSVETLDLSSFNFASLAPDDAEDGEGNVTDMFSGSQVMTVYVSEEWSDLPCRVWDGVPSVRGGKGTTWNDAEGALLAIDSDDQPGLLTPKIRVSYKTSSDAIPNISSELYQYGQSAIEQEVSGVVCEKWQDQHGNVYEPGATILYDDETPFDDIVLTPVDVELPDVPYAFAVANEDGTLCFYKDSYIPSAGEEYRDRVVDVVYASDDLESVGDEFRPRWRSNENITDIIVVDKIIPASIDYWFRSAVSDYETMDLRKLDTSLVTNMASLFMNNQSVKSIDLEGWNTDNVKDMSNMFKGCYKLESVGLAISGANSVKDMSNMFRNCVSLADLDLSAFSTRDLVYMEGMFYMDESEEPSKLTSVDLSSFNLHKVVTMRRMFYGCVSLENVNFGTTSSTARVEDLSQMFRMPEGSDVALRKLDLSRLSFNSLRYCESMFKNCSALADIDVTSLSVSHVKDMSYMFDGCSSLEELDLTSFEPHEGWIADCMFRQCSPGLTRIFVTEHWVQPESGSNMFQGDENLIGGRDTRYDSSFVNEERAIIDEGEDNPGYLTLVGDELDYPGGTFAVYNEESGTLTFYDRSYAPVEGSTFFGKTVDKLYRDFESETFECEERDGINVPNTPWGLDSHAEDPSEQIHVTSLIVKDPIKIAASWYGGSAAHWFEGLSECETMDVDKVDFTYAWNLDLSHMFAGCSSLKTLDLSRWTPESLCSMNGFFAGCTSLEKVNVSGWSTYSPAPCSLNGMFDGCDNLTSIDMSDWDMNVSDVSYLFSGLTNLETLDMSGWTSSSLTNMEGMLAGCENLTSLNLAGMTTKKVTNMSHLFEGCSSLPSIDLSTLDTTKVETMESIFEGCSSATEIVLGKRFKTDNVENLASAFKDCSSLTGLDITRWRTPKMTDMSHMFDGCSDLETITTTVAFSTVEVADRTSSIFAGCENLVGGNGTQWDPREIGISYAKLDGGEYNPGYFTEGVMGSDDPTTNFALYGNDSDGYVWLFFNGDEDTMPLNHTTAPDGIARDYVPDTFYEDITTVEDWETVKSESQWIARKSVYVDFGLELGNMITLGETASNMFNEFRDLKALLNLPNIDTSEVTDMSWMFNGCSALEELDATMFDTANVRDMSYMFAGTKLLTELDVSNFDTSKVTDMTSMFSGCENVSKLDLSRFNTDKLTACAGMFFWCHELDDLSLPVLASTKNKVTNLTHMFDGCYLLEALDLSKWDTTGVTDMSYMFSECRKLAELNQSFDTRSCTNFVGMFHETAFTTLDISNFDVNRSESVDSMLADMGYLVTLTLGTGWDGDKAEATGLAKPNLDNIDPSLNADGFWHLYTSDHDKKNVKREARSMGDYIASIAVDGVSEPTTWVAVVPDLHLYISLDNSVRRDATLFEIVDMLNKDGGTLVLQHNETLTSGDSIALSGSRSITIDLNGNTIKSADRNASPSLVSVTGNANVTITDGQANPTEATSSASTWTEPSRGNFNSATKTLTYQTAPLKPVSSTTSLVPKSNLVTHTANLSSVGAIEVTTSDDSAQAASAISVADGARLTISGGRITAEGIAVKVSRARFAMSGGYIVGCHTSLAPKGVAISADGAAATVDLTGGLIACNGYDDDGIVEESFVEAPSRLGAVCVTDRARLSMNGATIASNYQDDVSSPVSVAGVYIGGSGSSTSVNSTIKDSLITCNVNNAKAACDINATTLSPERTSANAGGIAISGSGIKVSFSDSAGVTGNVSKGVGGGAYLNSSVSMTDCYIIGNTAYGERFMLGRYGVEGEQARLSETTGAGAFVAGGSLDIGEVDLLNPSLGTQGTMVAVVYNSCRSGFGGLGVESRSSMAMTGDVRVNYNFSKQDHLTGKISSSDVPSNLYLNADLTFDIIGNLATPADRIGIQLDENPDIEKKILRKAFASKYLHDSEGNRVLLDSDYKGLDNMAISEILDELKKCFKPDDVIKVHVATIPKYGQYVVEVDELGSGDLYGDKMEKEDGYVMFQYFAWVESAEMLNSGHPLKLINTAGQSPINGKGTGSNPSNTTSRFESVNLDANGYVRSSQVLSRIFQERQIDAEVLRESELTVNRLDKFGLVDAEGYTTKQIWIPNYENFDNIDDFHNMSIDANDWYVYTYNPDNPIKLVYDPNANTNKRNNPAVNATTIYYNEDSIIRFVADPYTTRKSFGAKFYDYDITDGNAYGSEKDAYNQRNALTQAQRDAYEENGSTIYVNTGLEDTSGRKAQGINKFASKLSSSQALFAYGNRNCGTGVGERSWTEPQTNKKYLPNKYNNNSYGGCTFNLVLNQLDPSTGMPVFNGLVTPNMFGEEAETGKTSYDQGEYSLVFQNQGNVYTLEQVRTKDRAWMNLDKFSHPSIYDGIQNATSIDTNNFWPMDMAPSWGTSGHDPKTGYSPVPGNENYAKVRYVTSTSKSTLLPISDDALNHNYFFGMNFDVSFEVDKDYTGPLSFYFYGDDDMWVYLDGKKIADIGGVHSSTGYYVNLWEYLKDDQVNLLNDETSAISIMNVSELEKEFPIAAMDGNLDAEVSNSGAPINSNGANIDVDSEVNTHTLSVFFDERGASGSTCWVQMILPNMLSTTYDDSFSFRKVDEKGEPLAGATFTLYYDEDTTIEYGAPAVSDENGVVTFENLAPGNTYYMKETKTPKGYEVNGELYEVETFKYDPTTIKLKNGSFWTDFLGMSLLSGDTINGYVVQNVRERVKFPVTGQIGLVGFLTMGLILALGGYAALRLARRRSQAKSALDAALDGIDSFASNIASKVDAPAVIPDANGNLRERTRFLDRSTLSYQMKDPKARSTAPGHGGRSSGAPGAYAGEGGHAPSSEGQPPRSAGGLPDRE